MMWSQLERELGRDSFHGLFGNLFDAFGAFGTIGALGRHTRGFARTDLESDDTTATVTLELPGVDPDAIDIAVEGDTLRIVAERPGKELDAEERYHRRERYAGKLERDVALPYRVEADKVEAKFEHGVLQVRLPRAEQDRPHKVLVTARS
jgi:HSP20 family protein